MECLSSSRELSDYLNGRGTEQERREVHRHLSSCPRCADQAEERVRAAVLRLPVRTPDQALKTRLQVLASKESLRRRKRLSIAHAWKNWRENFQLSFKNLMRPLALPVAGGLISTAFLFGMLMPDLAVEVHPIHNDIETSVFTQATVRDITPISVADVDITVELTVDENGRMLEYRVVSGADHLLNESVRRRLEMNLMYGQFNPATQFGQPVAGKLRVSFRSSTIDIRG